jgi:hypothetical protein
MQVSLVTHNLTLCKWTWNWSKHQVASLIWWILDEARHPVSEWRQCAGHFSSLNNISINWHCLVTISYDLFLWLSLNHKLINTNYCLSFELTQLS